MIIRNQNRGFTFIELIAVIVITGILAGLIGNVLKQGFNNYYNARTLSDLSTQANISLMQMAGELRSALTFSTINSSQLTFTTTNGNSVTYNVSGNNLTRAINSGTAYNITNNISSATFRYFDKNGATTSSITAVSFITISLTLVSGVNTYNLITTVHPRNLT